MSLRYGTFNHVYKERWQDILGFRQQSQFTTCEVCFSYKQQLSDRGLTFEQKLGSLQGYRSHLHSQYCDRTVIWTLQQEAADPNSGVLLLRTDGLDQSKFRLPRHPELRANSRLPLYLGKAFCFVSSTPFQSSVLQVSGLLKTSQGQSIKDLG